MGMTLPDLPKRVKNYGRQWALAYFQAHGPATVPQMLPGATLQEQHNLQKVLSHNRNIFVITGNVVGESGHSNAIWGLVKETV
jgi:hypothetical protein